MAIEIDGKVYRNLQEQVKKNQDDIEDLQESVAQLSDNTYDKEQVDNKDAAVLTEAKEYTYSKTEIDNKDTGVLNDAKAYTYSKTESDNKFQTISDMSNYATTTALTNGLAGKFDKFVPTAGDIAGIELYDEEDYASLVIGVKNEGDSFYYNYVNVSGDGSVNIKATDTFAMGIQNNSGSVLCAKNHDMEFTAQSGYDINFKVGNLGKVCVTETGIGTLVKKEIALKEDIVPVIPNQSASATDTLTKLTIGSTVYSVGSGGGGTKYKHDMLLCITEDETTYGSVHMIFINDTNTAYTISTLPGYLTSSTYFYPIHYGRKYNNTKVINDIDRIYLHAWYNNALYFEEQDDFYDGQTYTAESINTFKVVLVNDTVTTV